MTITAPPLSVIYSEYRWMAFSVNLEERRAFERMLANAEIGSEERVIHLTSQEVSMLEQLLSDEGLKFLDGLDDPKYEAASLGWSFRDGWSASLTAYDASGSVAVKTDSLMLWFEDGDNPFVHLESWMEREIRIYKHARIVPTPCDVPPLDYLTFGFRGSMPWSPSSDV
ncbi:MAG: hypothetical protein IKL97_00395 [Eggerthellaceae bacterium]|nr:hypothetical protein [Eggerthellaceae bacterium]